MVQPLVSSVIVGMADVQAAAGSLAACPAASLLTAVALKLLNDTLVAEREVGTLYSPPRKPSKRCFLELT